MTRDLEEAKVQILDLMSDAPTAFNAKYISAFGNELRSLIQEKRIQREERRLDARRANMVKAHDARARKKQQYIETIKEERSPENMDLIKSKFGSWYVYRQISIVGEIQTESYGIIQIVDFFNRTVDIYDEKKELQYVKTHTYRYDPDTSTFMQEPLPFGIISPKAICSLIQNSQNQATSSTVPFTGIEVQRKPEYSSRYLLSPDQFEGFNTAIELLLVN